MIGAAGVAGAAGAAGVVLSHGNLPGVLSVTNVFASPSFHDPGCSGCLMDSGFKAAVGDTCGVTASGITFHNGNPSPGDFYLTFTAPSLPAGSYYVTNLSIDSHFSTTGTNPYYREIFTGGTAKCCPTSGPGTDNGVNLDAINLSSAHPTTFTGTGTNDLVLHVHITFSGPAPTSSGDTYTFFGDLLLEWSGTIGLRPGNGHSHGNGSKVETWVFRASAVCGGLR